MKKKSKLKVLKLKLKSRKLTNSLPKSKLRKKRSKFRTAKPKLKLTSVLLLRKTFKIRRPLLSKNLKLPGHWLSRPSKP